MAHIRACDKLIHKINSRFYCWVPGDALDCENLDLLLPEGFRELLNVFLFNAPTQIEKIQRGNLERYRWFPKRFRPRINLRDCCAAGTTEQQEQVENLQASAKCAMVHAVSLREGPEIYSFKNEYAALSALSLEEKYSFLFKESPGFARRRLIACSPKRTWRG
jgi:hypothetical protein